MSAAPDKGSTVAGLAVLGGLITGGVGLAMSIVACVRDWWAGGGVCLLAVAIAFGIEEEFLDKEGTGNSRARVVRIVTMPRCNAVWHYHSSGYHPSKRSQQ